MSVIMSLRAKGDPGQLEERAAANPDGMRALADRAKQHGRDSPTASTAAMTGRSCARRMARPRELQRLLRGGAE